MHWLLRWVGLIAEFFACSSSLHCFHLSSYWTDYEHPVSWGRIPAEASQMSQMNISWYLGSLHVRICAGRTMFGSLCWYNSSIWRPWWLWYPVTLLSIHVLKWACITCCHERQGFRSLYNGKSDIFLVRALYAPAPISQICKDPTEGYLH